MQAQTFSFMPLFYAVIILVGCWFLVGFVTNILQRLVDKSPSQKQPVFLLFSTVAKIGLWIIGIITAMGAAGINVSALVASLGLSGLALTIASKDMFTNMLAGVMLILNQPFQIGDTIEIGHHTGQVVKMSLRYTHLKVQNKEILIPNSSLVKRNITIHQIQG